MKIAFKLAFKNLINSGLRTWLNVGVLAFVFILILFFKGTIEGWNQSAVIKQIDWEYAEGQLRQENYEPENSFTIDDSHAEISDFKQKGLVPILVRQATVYPQGRLIPTLLKGIPKDQKVLDIPTTAFENNKAEFPVVIGNRMAEMLQVKKGAELLLRWRDRNGTFDAGSMTVVGIFDTDVASADQGQVWMPIEKVWEITDLQNEATYYLRTSESAVKSEKGFVFYSQDELLESFRKVIETESASSSIIYLVLLTIALLAIFDTQVLSIFRRQKEIGTYVALGMTRQEVMLIFTIEGSMYSVFATVIGCVLGVPLLLYFNSVGISFGDIADSYQNLNMGNTIYPILNGSLLITTIVLIVVSSAVVSFIPARKIAKLNPVLALKGKHQ